MAKDKETVLILTVSAEREVKMDRMTVIMRAEQTHDKALQAQATVNEVMKTALERARAANSDNNLTIKTVGYSVSEQFEYKANTSEVKKVRWKAQQGLRLAGTDTERLLKLATNLQEIGMLMGGIHFAVSSDVARKVTDELTQEALQRLHSRAKDIAGGLFLAVDHIKTITSQSGGGVTPRYGMEGGARAMAAAVPVQAEGGETTVSVGFSAEVILKST